MARDFVDKDLLSLNRGAGASASQRPAARNESAISNAGMAKLAQQKSELNHHVADAVHEIEELRQRQSSLEKEKRDLEELGRKQEEYVSGKKDAIERLTGSVMLLEKEELQAARMLELFGVIKTKFKESLTELRSISEDDWSEESYQMELNKAIVIVEDAQNIFKRGIAKMEAAGWNKESTGSIANSTEVAMKMQLKGFSYWLKVGVAVSIPFAIVGTILFMLWLYFSGTF